MAILSTLLTAIFITLAYFAPQNTVFGPNKVKANFNDTWTTLNITGAPSERYCQSAIWTGSKMIVWGGDAGPTYFNDGGIYDATTETWKLMSTVNAPQGRSENGIVWTGNTGNPASSNKIIVWGGRNVTTPLGTGGIYDLTTNSWKKMSDTNAPLARYRHSMIWTGSKVIVWGGDNSQSTFGDGGIYDPVTDVWEPIKPLLLGVSISNPIGVSIAPTPRTAHSTIWTGSKMIVWGGNSIAKKNNDGAIYDPATNIWKAISSVGAPTARAIHIGVWTGSKMIVWGGYEDGEYSSAFVNTGGVYDPSTDSWSTMSNTNAPQAREGSVNVWTGSKMIIWGGGSGNYYDFYNTGGVYNPTNNTWEPTSLVNAPSGRRTPTAVWTGTGMIVWGGYNSQVYPNPFLRDGAIYNLD